MPSSRGGRVLSSAKDGQGVREVVERGHSVRREVTDEQGPSLDIGHSIDMDAHAILAGLRIHIANERVAVAFKEGSSLLRVGDDVELADGEVDHRDVVAC